MSAQWPLIEQFRLRLTMESDWHIGSGTGRPGNIDRLVVRDGDGLPFVPAKTLRGIWRDACERLVRGLDDGKIGDWCSLAWIPTDPVGLNKFGAGVRLPGGWR